MHHLIRRAALSSATKIQYRGGVGRHIIIPINNNNNNNNTPQKILSKFSNPVNNVFRPLLFCWDDDHDDDSAFNNKEQRRSVHSAAAAIMMGRKHQQRSGGNNNSNNNNNNCWMVSAAPYQKQFQYLQHQQLRYRRHDRSSAFSKPRPKTKKQRKKYNKKMKKINDEQAKQKQPGYRAGPLREIEKENWQQLLDHGNKKLQQNNETMLLPATEKQYGIDDFMVEELIGNTSYLTSQPTPEPVYLGDMHDKLFNKVQNQMALYRKDDAAQAEAEAAAAEEEKESSEDKDNNNDDELLNVSVSSLPSDKDISKVIRAYRDKNGTRQRPIGIVKALQHVLKDLGIPTVAFGEYTYTSLLTCCRTPNEARRIFKLMDQLRHPISSYSWSILVDVHAKIGDYQGCANVIKEMASEGVAPTQAAYTSLLAACYKICNDGRIPHSIRAEAGKVGWKHWQELRIIGIEADAMAFGAMIRLCGARGQPERAINLLEEMKRFDVKPTTLCFTGALKAVARSHEIAIRFERGSSKKQLRRESMAAHHGKLARTIVVMADNAEVEQDEGFVSALMLCAAAAGDSASAKAILLASEVRRMDQLRTVGPGLSMTQQRLGETNLNSESLAPSSVPLIDSSSELLELNNIKDDQIQTYDDDNLAELDNMSTGLPAHSKRQPPVKSFGEREYGKDTRTISALLRACAQAMDKNGIGTIWAGTTNQGFLCENSQRLITTRWEPRLVDNSIPGESPTQIGIGALQRYDQYDDDDSDRKKGKRQKFRGLYIDDDPMTRAEINGSLDSDFDDVDLTNEIESESDLISASRSAPYNSIGDDSDTTALSDDDTSEIENMGDDFDEGEGSELFSLSGDNAMENGGMFHGFDEGDDAENFNFEGEIEDMFQSSDIFASEGDVVDPHLRTQNNSDLESAGESSVDKSIIVAEGNGSSVPDILENANSFNRMAGYSDKEIDMIEQLELALPGLPMKRIVKIVNVFNNTLGAPSMLQLVPILRETMPDDLNVPRLVKMNSQNAEFALQKAIETKNVNRQLLDSMLQVKSKSGAIDSAVEFYEERYRELRTKPNEYGDRLVFEMLVVNNRLQRAFAFKEKIEARGRNLDLASYGCIIEYYSKNSQIGSALMLLKECVSIHGAGPSEKYVSKLRRGCREMRIESEARLEDMIGKDPTEWLRDGIKYLKRERSKKGRRDVQYIQNRLL